MTFLDLIVGLLLFGFVLAGLWFGLIHMIGAVVGTVAGTVVAGHYAAMPVTFFGTSNIGRVALFFEGRTAAELSPLGELRTPSIADLFVAKMQGTMKS